MRLHPGESVGRYQILEALGVGGMATVYKAYLPALDRVVALKVLRPGVADDPDFDARFRREAQAVAKLRHPNVVQVFDFDEVDGRAFMAMEYLEGGTLKHRLANLAANSELLPPDDVVRIVREVATGLAYAHQNDIVHRDIKPSNILLTADGRAVVTDFGVAKMLSAIIADQTQTGVGIGTPEYMSPEQARGIAVDRRADVYALGVVAYEALTGRVPYVADTPLAVALAHAREPLPLPRSLNPRIGPLTERVLLKVLAKDPLDRFATAPEFADALAAAAQTDALTPEATIVTASPTRRWPWSFARTAATVLALTVVATAMAGSGLVLGVFTAGPDRTDRTAGLSAAPSGSATVAPAAARPTSTPGPAAVATSATPTASPTPTVRITEAPAPTIPPATAAPVPAVVVTQPTLLPAPTLPPSGYAPRTFDPSLPRRLVTGRATGVNGAGVGNVIVRFEDTRFDCCDPVLTVFTDGSGNYTASVTDGSYAIRFEPPAATGYSPQWWRAVLSHDRSTLVTVKGVNVTGVDAALSPGFLVSGRAIDLATGGGTQSSYVFFSVGCCDLVGGSSPDRAGNWSVRLPAGTYSASVGSGGRYQIPTAQTVVVAGDTGNIEFRLTPCPYATGGGACQ